MYQKTMVPLDGSELAEYVLPHIAAITEGGGVREVIFIRVVKPFNLTPVRVEPVISDEELEQLDAKSEAAADGYLDRLVIRVSYDKTKISQTTILGEAAGSLVDYATNNKVDLIAIATHGRSGLSRWIWVSTADRILRHTRVPIMMVRVPKA
jgi:nucleotide-binding universal stress UspA family protein